MFLKILEVISSTEWITLILTAILGFLILRTLLFGPKNLPPGPTGLPFVGYLPFILFSRNPHQQLRDLAKKYGDIMSVNMSGNTYIFLSSNDAIQEAFVNKGNETTARPELFVGASSLITSLGIVQEDGEVWKIHRRFALQTLRDFGFGKASFESRIQDIAEDIIKVLEDSRGKPIDVKEILSNSTANVICSLVFDKHFKMDNPVFQRYMYNFNRLLSMVSINQSFINGPMLSYLPLQHLPVVKAIFELNGSSMNIIQGFIKEHQETFDPNFLRDYVDVFLDEMRKNETSGKMANSTFTIDRLTAIASDLLNAGTETTSSTIHWALRILMFRPEIQKKLQAEIDEVIGKERFPSVMDRPNMPYTEATINEVLRISSLVPLGIFHSNEEEVKIRNYVIPKRSFIVPNHWALHHDPNYWPNPDKFDPSRFLSSDGKLVKKESFIPFSAGKRICLGETLARTELFIFLASILQRFIIVPGDGDTDSSLKIKLARFLVMLEPYNLCAHPRY